MQKKKLDSFTINKTIILQKASLLEGMNSAEAKSLFAAVTDLYEEIEDFEESSPPAAINALTPHLKNVKDMLEAMMQNPMSYVSTPKQEKEHKKVILKPVKDDD